jgi:hypothetical protein
LLTFIENKRKQNVVKSNYDYLTWSHYEHVTKQRSAADGKGCRCTTAEISVAWSTCNMSKNNSQRGHGEAGLTNLGEHSRMDFACFPSYH